jgi:hypothetical protein
MFTNQTSRRESSYNFLGYVSATQLIAHPAVKRLTFFSDELGCSLARTPCTAASVLPYTSVKRAEKITRSDHTLRPSRSAEHGPRRTKPNYFVLLGRIRRQQLQ